MEINLDKFKVMIMCGTRKLDVELNGQELDYLEKQKPQDEDKTNPDTSSCHFDYFVYRELWTLRRA